MKNELENYIKALEKMKAESLEGTKMPLGMMADISAGKYIAYSACLDALKEILEREESKSEKPCKRIS